MIGPNADEAEVLAGNYNGTPVAPVTVLAGIRAAAGPGTKVTFARGGPLATGLPDLHVVPGSALSTGTTPAAAGPRRRLLPAATSTARPCSSAWTPRSTSTGRTGRPTPRSTTTPSASAGPGAITAPATGRYTLGMRCATQCRILVSTQAGRPGPLRPRARHDHGRRVDAGRASPYPIRLELEHEKYDAIAQLLWETPGGRGDEVAEAVAAAQAADAVVMVLGLSSRLEGEEMPVRIEGFAGGDRTSLDLPKVQQQLMEKVVAAAKGKPVVLVLLNGSALSIGWADQNVPAIVEAWYGGQAAGTAVGEVLFGDVSPAGRLPAHLLPLGRPAPALRRLRDEGPHLPLLHRRAALPLRPRPQLLALRLREARRPEEGGGGRAGRGVGRGARTPAPWRPTRSCSST